MQRPVRRPPFPALLLLLLLLSALLAGCGAADAGVEPAAAAAAPPAEIPSVAALQVTPRTLPLLVEATGRVEAWRQVVVYSEAGGLITGLEAVEGRRVAQGALLLALDDRDAALDLAEMEAEWLRAQASYAISYAQSPEQQKGAAAALPAKPEGAKPAGAGAEELDRQLADGIVSRQEYVRRKRDLDAAGLLTGGRQTDVRAATTGVLQAEQRVARSRLALEKKKLFAPLAGLVADLAVALGQRINAGEAVLTLIEDRRLKVEVDVLEADLVRTRPGARAEVRIPAADLELPGRVYSINPRIDPATGTGRVTVEIENPGGALYAGLFANVAIELESLKERLAVPASAILQRQGRSLVFKIDGPPGAEKALWTWVEVGEKSGDWVEIRSGLAAGDWVATGNHFALGHETRVAKAPAAPADSAATAGSR